jgi:DNA sulfur modification protein DndB
MPGLRDETLAVVIFPDAGLERSQQLFADLNKHATRPTASLGILYEHRDDMSGLCRHLAHEVPCFRGLTEMERNSTSRTSKKLFTLSAIYQATSKLLGKKSRHEVTVADRDFTTLFWTQIGEHMPDWMAVKEGRRSPGELRQEEIQCHGLVLQALGRAVAALVEAEPETWQQRLGPLRSMDWTRANPVWEGRALTAGRMSKSTSNLVLTANVIKQTLGLELSPDEELLEQQYAR